MNHEERDALIKQLREVRVESALANCHHHGLHSIVLETRTNGSLRRIFYADVSHRMDRVFDRTGHFTLGAHNHDKPLKFDVLFGNVWNVVVFPGSTGIDAVDLYEYEFTSALTNGQFSLSKPAKVRASIEIQPLDHSTMGTGDFHTVLVSSLSAAWLVDEGPTESVQKYIFSPRSDLALDAGALYQPMPDRLIARICKDIAHAMESAHA